MDSQISRRIAMLRFIMIFGVVILHTPLYVPIENVSGDWFPLVKSFFQNAFFRGSVPVLTFISGYLLFRSNLDIFPLKLYIKKSKSFCIPFLFFNISLLCFMVVVGMDTGESLLDAALAISGDPVNYPLKFLRDMIVLMLITPIIGAALRGQSLIGLLGTIIFFSGDYDGMLILRNEIPIIFYVGGMAAFHNVEMRIADKFALPCLLTFVLICTLIVYFRIANTNFVRCVAPLLLWPSAALLRDTSAGRLFERLSKYSFFIFCAHAPVLAATYLLYQRAFQTIPYVVYWIAAPVVTVIILIIVYELSMRLCPTLFRSVLGMEKIVTRKHISLAVEKT